MTTLAHSAPRSRLHVPELLREVVFRRYWSAHTVSLLGDQITLLALPLVAVLALDASAAQMGYLTATALLPNLLFALHAGAWVDRFGRRRFVTIACDLGRAALLAAIPVSYAFGTLTFPQLAAVAFGLGTLSVAFGVADASLFVSIVPHDRFVDGSSLLSGSRAPSYVAGPSAAGLLVRALSAPGALIADALSFVASAALLGRIAPTEAPPDTDGDGVLEVDGTVIRRTLVPARDRDRELLQLRVLGPLRALRNSLSRDQPGPLGLVVFPAPLLLVPLATGAGPADLALLFLAEFGAGFGVMMLDISAGSLFAAVIPHRLRSRVSGAYTFANYGVRVLGSLVGGALGTAIGLRSTLWLATAGALLGVLWLLPSPVMRMRELPPQADS